jgi:hypothetical protein
LTTVVVGIFVSTFNSAFGAEHQSFDQISERGLPGQ